MSIYDVSSVIHPILEYKTSKYGIIYTNIICKDKKLKRWSSNGKVLWSWCICGGLLSGLDQDFDLCSGSLLRWDSLLSWSSQLELWDLMVLGGQKWSERLGVCDPRVCGALLFRCMIVRLCWHFSNFPWLCKVFLQTFLHFASQFRNLKVISKVISQPFWSLETIS